MGLLSPAKGDWTLVQRARVAAKFRLYCFPYAGAGATIFHGWSSSLPPDVEVRAIRLPGRESRIREPTITRMPELVATLRDVLAPELDAPYGFFGHSMGAQIAFELTRAVLDAELPTPRQIWLSGSRAPHLPRRRAPIHDLPEDELLAELRRTYDAPAALLDDPELVSIYLPILRADLTLLDAHAHRPGSPLPVPLSAFGGADDPIVPRPDLDAWSAHTSARFEVAIFPGGHLFPRSARPALLARLAQDLDRCLAR